MAKEIKYDMDARDLLKKGVDELANAMTSSIVPKYRYSDLSTCFITTFWVPLPTVASKLVVMVTDFLSVACAAAGASVCP